jgi:hypothetical protein
MRFRFTIRDLLWLTLVVALGVGWWIDRRSIQRQSATEFNALRQDFITVRDRAVSPIVITVRDRAVPSAIVNDSSALASPMPEPLPTAPPAKPVP